MSRRPSLLIAATLGFVGFVTSFGAHIVAVNLPFYAEKVGVGLAMIGLLIAAYDLAEIVAKPIFGALADRQGMKRTMLLGIGVFIAASLLYLVIDPRWLLLVRFLQGAGAAALSAVSLALVGVYYPHQRGRAFGTYNALKGAGYVISPLVGGVIVARQSFSGVFIASAGVGVLALLLSLALPPTTNAGDETADDDEDFSLRAFLGVFREPRLLPWYAATVVNMFYVGILFGFLPVRAHALGFTPTTSGVLLAAVSLAYLLVQPLAGVWADRVSPEFTIRIGLLLAGLAVIMIPFARGPLLVASVMLAGLSVGTVWTNADTVISTLARQGRLGSTMGAAGSFKELGDMVGPILVGSVSQAFGLTVGFVGSGVLGWCALALITGFGRRSSTPS
jgi:DHA1 family tetracycline resistance protein-like MFS transporter